MLDMLGRIKHRKKSFIILRHYFIAHGSGVELIACKNDGTIIAQADEFVFR